MIRFVLLKIGLIVPALVGMVMLSFALIHLIPGDPVEIRYGERGLSAEDHARILHEMGLDRPLWQQLADYLSNVARGDLGNSIATRQPIVAEFARFFPATVELVSCAMLLAVAIGIPCGVVAATRRGSAFDHGLMGVSLTGYSTPVFWWALLLILLFSVQLGWTPVSGRISPLYDVPSIMGFMLVDTLFSDEPGAWLSAAQHILLPAIVLATAPLATIARITRSAMLEILGEDYIRTARAKGVSPFRVVNVHALRNALIPVVTIIGLQVGTLLGGAILVETIFSWPGVGNWLYESVSRRDYPVLQGGVLLLAIVVMAVNLFVDVIYGFINPQIRHGRLR